MSRPAFLAPGRCTLIGMVHLPPLPGAPRFDGDPLAVEQQALRDIAALESGGADAVLVENFHDAPFYPDRVPVETVAAMAAVVRRVRLAAELPVGVNVLRNDGMAAMAVAAATGADFVRVNVLVGARLTDQGIVSGIAHELLRLRRHLAADRVAILADVAVKHSAALADYPVAQEVADALARGGADALIVSGTGTGQSIERTELHAVRAAAGGAPVLVGSGVTADSAADLAATADGLIVGTSLRYVDGPERGVDPDRVRRLRDRLGGR